MSFLMKSGLMAVALLVAAPAFAQDLVFDLINDSSVDLHELYVSAHASDEWGDDVLGTDVLASGESGSVTIADGEVTCAYDLRFVSQEGDALERTNVDLCEQDSFTLSD